MDISTRIAAATLRVDAARLRSTLDRLRDALDRPHAVSSIPTGALVHDHRAVAASLRFVIERLGAVDLIAVQALSGVMKEYRTEHDAGKLREVFAGLQRGWQERVRCVLGVAKAPIVSRLLASPAPDLLRILGKEDDENAHSDLIAWLLDPRKAPVVAPHALRRLAARLDDDDWRSRIAAAVATDSLSVRREVKISREFGDGSDLDRVDITISGPGFVLAIENKVWSREHGDQTQVYWSWIAPMRCLRGGMFLSPSGLSASCSEFKAVSYLELVSCLVEGPSIARIEFDESTDLFAWQATLVPAASYNRVDDVVWHQWSAQQPGYPGSRHQDKANTVRFVSRPLGTDVTAEVAFNDVKTVLEFVLTAESPLAEAVGLDAGPGED